MIEVPLPLERAIPLPGEFRHQSSLHGQRHVGRVMVHAMRLAHARGHDDRLRAALWAAVYIHDLERRHDGECTQHGRWAARRLADHAPTLARLDEGGVQAVDRLAIRTAVTFHSLPRELPASHAHWTLTALLKDADALDRVRLGDLDPRYLRLRESHGMIDFAQRLFDGSDHLDEGPAFFADVVRLSRSLLPASSR
ncbi:MAG: hypothetical protein U0Q55_02825 [Vicinamibacterales bacterium]